jgi:hypothetical protein
MAGHVISHRKPRRKRGGAWGWAARRLGAFMITVAALVFASWLSARVERPLPPAPAGLERLEAVAPAPVLPAAAETPELDAAAELPARAPQRRPRRARGIPLNAAAEAPADGYEVLSAAELDGISQARE